MALIQDQSESEIRTWLEAFFAALAAATFGGTAGLASARLVNAGRAIAGSGQDIGGSVASFQQAFIAGKVAGVIGTDQVRKMSEKQLLRAVENSPISSLTEKDQRVLEQLNKNAVRSIKRRFAIHEAEVEQTLSIANARWAGSLQSGEAGTAAGRAVARRSTLSQLAEELGFQLATVGSDTKRFMQTELANYFQRGEVQEAPADETVWKIPRAEAERQCMRLHLNPDGSPRRYLLADVIGNSNLGLPPEQWQFVIGATHPFCYCILFQESIEKRPGPNKQLADRREETLREGVQIPTAAGAPSQAARRGRSVLPKGTTRGVRIGDTVIPIAGPTRVTAVRGRRASVARSGANSTKELYKVRGTWIKSRRTLHEQILGGLDENVIPVVAGETPIFQLTGGGSASGKGSLLKQGKIKPDPNQVHIDSDEIKQLLPEYHAQLAVGDQRAAAFVHDESSELAKRAIQRGGGNRMNMTLDGTGDGTIESLKEKILPQRARGYKVVADYVYIPTEEAVKRSAARAARSGREVPEGMIRGTHKKVSQVVPKALEQGLFDEFRLWDNTTRKVELIAEKLPGGKLRILKQKEWNDFIAKGGEGVTGKRAVEKTVTVKPAKPEDVRKIPGSETLSRTQAERLAGAWQDTTGNKIELAEYFSSTAKGAKIEFKQVLLDGQRTGKGRSSARLRINSEFSSTVDATHKGSLIRVFTRPSGGELSVEHSFFRLSPGARGQGLGKTILRNQLEIYEKIGVKNITLTAGEELGGYAWGRYGFSPTAPSWKVVKDEVRERLGLLGSDISEAARARVRVILQSDNPKDIWKIADLREEVVSFTADPGLPAPTRATESLGSHLLRGTKWKGGLDLGDAEAMARFKNYVGA